MLQLVGTLLFQLTVLRLIGVGGETDAWVAAQAVPLVVFSILSSVTQGAWQSRLATAKDQVEWLRTQRVAQGQLLLVYGSALLLLCLTAGLWVKLLFPGLSELNASDAVRMTRVLLVNALLNGQVALLTTALRSRNQFISAEVVALSGVVGAIALALLAVPLFGVEAAAWVSLARSIFVCGILFPLASGPTPLMTAAWKDKWGWEQSRPILFSSLFYKMGPLVDRFWSSFAPVSGMTLFNLAQTGMAALAMVLERAICMPYIPSLARLASERDFRAMRRVCRRSLVRTLLAVLLLLSFLVALYPLWPGLLGPLLKFDDSASMTVWWLCLALIGFLYASAAGTTIMSSFYALGDPRTPARIGVSGFAMSLIMKALAFSCAGLIGLALATAAYYMGNMLVMYWLLERRLNRLASRSSHAP